MKYLFFLLPFILLTTACKEKNKVQTNPELFNNYITGQSAHTISRCSNIYVNLAFAVGEDVLLPEDLFLVSPAIGGKLVISENRKLITLKDVSIKHNIKYEVTFKIGKLVEMPEGMEDYFWQFEAQQQSWNLSVNTPIAKSMEQVSLTGNIEFDVCEPDKSIVEDALSATQDGKPLHIIWSYPNNNERYCEYRITNIKRKNEAGIVELNLSMDPINMDDKASLKVFIPSKSDFSLYATKIKSNQHIEISFTDPILKTQVLDGLITIKDRKIKQIKIINNHIHVYLRNKEYGYFDIKISKDIKNIAGFPVKDEYLRKLFLAPPKPRVQIAEKGHILPPSGNWDIPVSIVSASGFRLRILKVYEHNAFRFYQENNRSLNNQTGLENLGRIVFDSVFVVEKSNMFYKSVHSISLDHQINKEKGALYKVFLSIPFSHNKYPCEERKKAYGKDFIENINFDKPSASSRYNYDYYGYDDYGRDNYLGSRYYYDNNLSNNNYMPNPCSDRFEQHLHDQRLLICSDIGIVIKSEPSKDSYLCYTSKITTAEPIIGAEITFYNFQGNKIKSAISDGNGFSMIATQEIPYLVKTSYNGQYTYILVNDAKSLSMSSFQVEGKKWEHNKKVFFYGDRDVWRPGDSVFMHSIVFDDQQRLPKNLPINLTLYDPTNKLVKKWTVENNKHGLYDCRFKTEIDAQTGYWSLEKEMGGMTYKTRVRIETIRPNRLKMNMDFSDASIIQKEMNKSAPIHVKWMHGLPGASLFTEVKMLQKSIQNPFGLNYKNYVFNDIQKSYTKELGIVASGNTDEEGILPFDIPTENDHLYPSMMLFNFEIRAFEKGGAFSTDMKAVKYAPYFSYVGAKFPGGVTSGEIYIKKDEAIQVICLDPGGKPISGEVEVNLWRIDHEWWYQFGSKGNYAALENHMLTKEDTYNKHIKKSGTAISIAKYGRFFITIKDKKSGHSVSRIVYSYQENYWSDGGDEVAQLEVLPFLLEKEDYKVGELLEFNLPNIRNGRYLITLESGGEIKYKEIRRSENNTRKITIPISKSMTPTAYVNVHLIQAWNKHENNRPLRLFGVKPIKIYDPNTILEPEISMKDEIAADKSFEIEIAEHTGKEMSYTIAVVDEGLLDITQFRTPDPWASFYTKEGLIGKTWDMYREVFQRFLGVYSSLLAVGGDGASSIKPTAKAQRFKPAVKLLGPFTLGKGEKRKHSTIITDYVGSVKVMVVATDGKSFGHKDKIVPVKKPLMLYTTLPRVLGPGEALKVPVTVFAMDKSVRDVEVSILTNEYVLTEGDKKQNIHFEKNGELDIMFNINIPKKLGMAKITILAKSGNHSAKEVIDIDVRPSAAALSETIEVLLEGNSQKSIDFKPIGMVGTQSAKVTISRGLNFSFEPYVNRLSTYPHGCLEQTVSSVFPQLFLYKMHILENEMEEMMFRNRYNAAIQKLRFMQMPNGGFSYWSGGNVANSWGTSYALEFLLEAKKLGYKIPQDMLDKVVKYQYKSAENWMINSNNKNRPYNSTATLRQAYKLYTLVKAGKPNYAAMNRLRLVPSLHNTAKWMLAHSLSLVGENSAAERILELVTTDVGPYKELGGSYGSRLRDQALILRILVERGKKLEAKRLVDELISYLKDEHNRYISTQEMSQLLISFVQFIGSLEKMDEKVDYNISISDNDVYENESITDTPKSYNLNKESLEKGSINITNKGKSDLFASILSYGTPMIDETAASAQDLKMEVQYYMEGGEKIDPKMIKRGTDFIVDVKLIHNGTRMRYDNLALTTIFPSGWEIINQRVFDTFSFDAGDESDYQNFRDDRVYTYFSIPKGGEKVFRFKMNATYAGRYWAPPAFCEAMYDSSIRAKASGFWAEVK